METPPPYPKTTGYEPCATTDPELFFPERRHHYIENTKIAKSLCQTCPIRLPCRDYAIGTDVEGIWGGTDDQERKKIQQEQGIEPYRFTKELALLLQQLTQK